VNFTNKDLKHIYEVHPDLQQVVFRAAEITKQPFIITDGARTLEEQKGLVAKGASKTLRSRHIPGDNGYSHAIDVAPIVKGKINWDWKYFYPIADAFKQAARELNTPIEWGGNWKSFKDGPHFQLPWDRYPGDTKAQVPVDFATKFEKKFFFDAIRNKYKLTDVNVDGFDRIIDMAIERNVPQDFLAYALATVWIETNNTMQPVEEAYWVKNPDEWRKKNLRYYPYHGRGLVQTTWKENYKKLGDLVGVDFVSDPDKLLSWDFAAEALFVAMQQGMYTGKKLSDYIDNVEESDAEDLREFREARRIINGTDRADEIARIALDFRTALKRAAYNIRDIPELPTPTVESKVPEQKEVPTTISLTDILVKIIKAIFGIK
jgi:hypothetical protein